MLQTTYSVVMVVFRLILITSTSRQEPVTALWYVRQTQTRFLYTELVYSELDCSSMPIKQTVHQFSALLYPVYLLFHMSTAFILIHNSVYQI